MTKDEALVKYNEIDRRTGIRPFWEVRDIIENLCSQIEELQNRSCESCKFGMTYHFDDEIECFKIEADTQGIYFSKDFCCNKWESIDEK